MALDFASLLSAAVSAVMSLFGLSQFFCQFMYSYFRHIHYLLYSVVTFRKLQYRFGEAVLCHRYQDARNCFPMACPSVSLSAKTIHRHVIIGTHVTETLSLYYQMRPLPPPRGPPFRSFTAFSVENSPLTQLSGFRGTAPRRDSTLFLHYRHLPAPPSSAVIHLGRDLHLQGPLQTPVFHCSFQRQSVLTAQISALVPFFLPVASSVISPSAVFRTRISLLLVLHLLTADALAHRNSFLTVANS